MRFKHQMATIAVWLNRNTGYLLLVVIVFFGLAILGFQRDNRILIQDIRHISEDTQSIVSKQDETLEAIKQLALDNRISGEQLKEILVCILAVPPDQRSTFVENQCKEQAAEKYNPDTIRTPGEVQQTTPSSTPPPEVTTQPRQEATTSAPPEPGLVERLNTSVGNVLKSIFGE